jgi:hypothetical protein
MNRTLRCLVILLTAGPALAEEANEGEETPPVEPSPELERMEARLEALSGQVETLTEGLESERAARGEIEAQLERQRVLLEAEARRQQQEYERGQDERQMVYDRDRGLRWRIVPERFELGARGFVWARYNGGLWTTDRDDEYGDEPSKTYLNEFTLSEVRLRVTAYMGGDRVRAVIEPTYSGGDYGNQGEFGIHDGYLELRLHSAFNIRAGQMRVEFDRETSSPLPLLPMVGYSPLQWFFSHGWDLGVLLHGTAGSRFAYAVGMYNGAGRDERNDNNSMLWSAMIRVRAVGQGSWNGWSDLERSSEFRLNLGAGFTQNAEEYGKRLRFTGDLQMQWRGLTVAYIAYYQGYHREESDWDIDEWIHSHGHQVHLGFVPWRDHMELLFRFSWLDPDTETDSEYEDQGYEIAAGYTLFLLGQNAKLTVQYSYLHHMEGYPRDSLVHLFRIQAQGWF